MIHSAKFLCFCFLILITTVSHAATASVQTGKVASTVYTPLPYYPYDARKWHMHGSGLFVLRIDIKTGKVKRVTMAKSTGHSMLDDSCMDAFKRWRFQPGKLLPISKILPSVNDPAKETDSLAKVPVTFVLGPR
jgi:TonB family protein